MTTPDFTTPRNPVVLWSNGAVVGASNPLPISGTLTASLGAFQPTAQTILNASTGTSRVALPDSNSSLVVSNTGANTIYIVLGGSSVTATTSAFAIVSGAVWALNVGSATYLAGITANGNSTLVLTTGTGLPTFAFSSVNASQSGTWTISLPSGAATSALQSSTQGSVGGGIPATASTLIGGIYNTSLPSLTNGQQASLQVDAAGRLIVNVPSLPAVTTVAQNIVFTDRSGTLTTGGASQQLAASNSSRKRLFVQNPSSATESLFINFTSAASLTVGSIELLPGGSFDTAGGPITTEAVNVIAATTGHAWVAKEA